MAIKVIENKDLTNEFMIKSLKNEVDILKHLKGNEYYPFFYRR